MLIHPAYIPTTWRAKAGGPDEDGVPTSYYAAVQLTCQAEIVDDPQRKAELLRRQLAHFQPRGDHAQVAVDMPPYGRMLSGIRGLRLHVASVAAKFKELFVLARFSLASPRQIRLSIRKYPEMLAI